MKKIGWVGMICSVLLFSGCTVNDAHKYSQQSVKQEIANTVSEGIKDNQKVLARSKELPRSVEDLMAAKVQLNRATKKKVEAKFDVKVYEVEAKDFFLGLMKDSDYNVMLDPSLDGERISLDLKNVTIPQVMEAVRDNFGYEYQLNDYGYYIYGRKLVSKLYHVNYINLSRKSSTTTNLVSSGQLSATDTGVVKGGITTDSYTLFWTALEENLNNILAIRAEERTTTQREGRVVVVNANANSVFVRAYPEELRVLDKYLMELQATIQRQVVIEAKVLEVELEHQFSSGIDWSLALGGRAVDSNGNIVGKHGFIGQRIPFNFNDSNMVGNFNGRFSSFQAGLKLLNGYGKLNVLSNPRITTLNNQKAVIKVGSEQYYVTKIKSTSNGTIIYSGVDGHAQQDVDIETQVFFSGVALDVTPQIDKDDNIILHIHPTVCDVTNSEMTVTYKGEEIKMPTAKSNIKESDTIVKARSGEVIVIGGLMGAYSKVHEDSLPGLDKIPVVSALVGSQDRTIKKYEMVFLLKPIIVKTTEDWNAEMQKIADRVVKLQASEFTYKFKER